MRFKIIIEYDGTNYSGWQIQANALSIQESIQKAIKEFSSHTVEIFGAGRTDAGVHARGQVAHFDMPEFCNFSEDTIKNAINYYLKPQPIVVTNCIRVNEEFHARFSAKKRYYGYKILNRDAMPALEYNRVWHISKNLDPKKLAEAAKHLEGQHDFSSFRSSQCQSSNPVKTIDSISISKNEDIISINISAKSFLHHMVRNIVGTIYLAGIGKIPPSHVKNILEARDRKKAGITAPACGLYFLRVDYSFF